MSLILETAALPDAEACAHLLATALGDDAVVRAMVPGDRRRTERLTSLYLTALRMGPLPHGTVDVARREPSGPVLGVAVWECPGSGGRWARLRGAPGFLRAIGLRHLPAAFRALREFGAHRPGFDHWYLSDIAVDAGARGLGVGSALLAHRLGELDAIGSWAYLEATTPGSRRLYERHGFIPAGQLTLRGATATPMLRPPARPAR